MTPLTGLAASPVSPWQYVLDSGLLDRCEPANRAVIAAAYREGDLSPAWDSYADDQAVYLPPPPAGIHERDLFGPSSPTEAA